ncbi:MAG TPA: L,D-transpeptidase family protein [Blastocatellia bacterium]|nr:L,D-transpeptidase family protein [Blastocatellia bacterium]
MKKVVLIGLVMFFLNGMSACQEVREKADPGGTLKPPPPVMEIAPLEPGRGQWKIAAAEQITVTISAPGAERVQILSQPEDLAEASFEWPALTAPVDRERGRFTAQLALTPDFAGELWAEAIYPGGAKLATEKVALTWAADSGTAPSLSATGGSVGTDESARSDKLTGGRIQKAKLVAGDPDVRITVNLPAFMLTLWQRGREVRTYPVGIGRKNFPVPIGEREASRIIFNPNWIPPDSGWVRRLPNVEPYDRIPANDPRNPLGRIKIPLGGGYLIHEAAKEDEIGHAVSHGCLRMRSADLFDLAEKIIAARRLPVTPEQLRQVRQSRQRLALTLDAPLLVDINYDLQVVEGGVLHLYPDVYGRGTFALDSLRAELQAVGLDGSKLPDPALRQLIDRANGGEQFVISVADIRKRRWSNGATLPLTERLSEKSRELALTRAR